MTLPAPMTRHLGRCAVALFGAASATLPTLGLASEPRAAAQTRAGPALEPPQPGLTPTEFLVHNGLPTPMLGLRFRTGPGTWASVGDVPSGDSHFVVSVPAGRNVGSFEFQYEDQRASGEYTLGGYRADAPGQVHIDVEAGPGAQGAAGAVNRGSVRLAPTSHDAPVDPFVPSATLYSLIAVPAAQAESSAWMYCLMVAGVPSTLRCAARSLQYTGFGFGFGAGTASGYFWSDVPTPELMNLFPVRTRVFGALGILYIDFYTRESSLQPAHTVGRLVGAGAAIGVSDQVYGRFSDPNTASEQVTPAGSYRKSCADLDYDPATMLLRARCLDGQGRMAPTQLDASYCFGGDLMNANGRLLCEGPPGDYRKSCAPTRYHNGVLQACCSSHGSASCVSTRLDYANDCRPGSRVSYIGDTLRCDTARLHEDHEDHQGHQAR